MEYARFFTSLMWGSIVCIPVMVLVGREVDQLSALNDHVWIPILVGMISLTMKVLLQKKSR